MIFFFLLTASCLAVLFYHYLGYPALLWLLAKIQPRPIQVGAYQPPVSLIISAYNEAAVIREKIENSLQLDYSQLEIILISDGSDDETAEIAQGFARQGIISLHQPERRGKGAAMNRAARQATGEILVFSDANAFYLPDAISKIAGNFNDPAVGCVTGKKTVRREKGTAGEGEGLYWRYESAIKTWESALNSTAGVVGEMIALRRQMFQPIPAGVINDDVYLGLFTQRAGYRVAYEPQAISWERPSASMDDDMARRRRMTAGRFQAFFKPSWWPLNNPIGFFMLVSHKFLRLLLPFFMIGALAGNIGMWLAGDMPAFFEFALIAQLLFYGLAGFGWLGDKIGRKWKLSGVAYYIVSGNLSSLAGLSRYLSGKQTPLWQKAAR